MVVNSVAVFISLVVMFSVCAGYTLGGCGCLMVVVGCCIWFAGAWVAC